MADRTSLRRLMVSGTGVVHHPNCPRVPVNAELHQWGEIFTVGHALHTLRTGGTVVASRRRKAIPGPSGRSLCHCLDDTAA